MDPVILPLRDIHLPEPISWWPPAVGWIVLASVCLLVACAAIFLYRRYARTRAQRAALTELDTIIEALAANGNGHACAQALSRLTRRVALLYGGRDVAAAIGDDWLGTINELGRGEPLTAPVAQVLLVAPYSRTNATGLSPEAYRAAADHLRHWIHDIPRVSRSLKRHGEHAAV